MGIDQERDLEQSMTPENKVRASNEPPSTTIIPAIVTPDT